MAQTYAQQLEAAKTVLDRRLAGDAWESYDVPERRLAAMPIDKLQDLIDWLERKAATESGSSNGGGSVLLRPIDV